MAIATIENKSERLKRLIEDRAVIGFKDPRNDFSKWRLGL